MLFKLTTDKSVSETAEALRVAVQANHFGIMQVHNLQKSMIKKGVGFAHKCLIFEVWQLRQPKQVLEQNMSDFNAITHRISIYRAGSKTTLATMRIAPLALFDTPQLAEVAQEVGHTIGQIMKEAASAGMPGRFSNDLCSISYAPVQIDDGGRSDARRWY